MTKSLPTLIPSKFLRSRHYLLRSFALLDCNSVGFYKRRPIRPICGTESITASNGIDIHRGTLGGFSVKCRVDVTKLIQLSAVVILLLMPCLPAIDAGWKTFASRGGWNIIYPADWRIGSCQTCNDPKAADVFVDFSPPPTRTTDGWVMVSPLARKPSDIQRRCVAC